MTPLPGGGALKPEWDTPANGDFARYVERLSAVHTVKLPDEPGRVPRAGEMMKRLQSTVVIQKQSEAQEQTKPGLATVLRLLVAGVILLVLVQLLARYQASLGPVLALGIAGLAWWMVGRWRRTLGALGKGSLRPSFSSLSALQRELQALAQQKSRTAQQK